MTQQSAWDLQRPIYLRLPAESEAYQGNSIVDAITQPWDALLVQLQDKLQNIERDYLNPVTARSDALDWLAQLCGFTGEYWDTSWSDIVKRQLIANAHKKIWYYKGTGYLLQYLLDLFGLKATVAYESSWLVAETAIGSPISGRNLYYGIVLSSDRTSTYFYQRNSAQWRLIERLNKLYMPCWCSSVTTNGNFLYYADWLVGYSEVGDPIGTIVNSTSSDNTGGANSSGIPQSLFANSTPDSNIIDATGYELGMVFQSAKDGTITAINFWKSANETGSHTGRIWSSIGTLLASIVFSAETASGWQQATLSSPLSITANTQYVVSVNANAAFAYTSNGFDSAIVLGDLTGIKGVYASVGVFPTQVYANTNYFRDIVFVAS